MLVLNFRLDNITKNKQLAKVDNSKKLKLFQWPTNIFKYITIDILEPMENYMEAYAGRQDENINYQFSYSIYHQRHSKCQVHLAHSLKLVILLNRQYLSVLHDILSKNVITQHLSKQYLQIANIFKMEQQYQQTAYLRKFYQLYFFPLTKNDFKSKNITDLKKNMQLMQKLQVKTCFHQQSQMLILLKNYKQEKNAEFKILKQRKLLKKDSRK